MVGAEIDLVLERPDGVLWAIEIKRGLAAKLERGFHHARQDLTPAKAFVVYSGEERYPVADGIEAIGVRELAALWVNKPASQSILDETTLQDRHW